MECTASNIRAAKVIERWYNEPSLVCSLRERSSLFSTPALRPLYRSNMPAHGEEGNW